jgi:uncharacterized SAM-binding protein YcdF (DUF218 family)
MQLRRDSKKRVWRWARLLAISLLSWSLLAWVAARALITEAPLERADALVVLSGSAAYGERTRRAAELFHEGRAPLILLTNDNLKGGWSSLEQRNPLFAERARDELLRARVPAEKIILLPGAVYGTYDEASLVKDYAAAHGLHSLLFVTSAYHSRRALWTAERVFSESGIAVGLSAVPPGEDSPRAFLWWLSFRGWRMVAEEYPKLIYYRLWYR